ncbi:MAG: S-adenosylmethionine:tRNA ribosyltransferase-isomerase, partial [Bdellovibrio sp.]
MSPHFSKKAADLAFELEGISTWSRVVTLMMRPYAYLFLPFWHYVNKVTGQNILEAWRAGLGNPLARYNGDSTFGKKLGLNPGEKVSVGVMNPFKSSPEREQQKEQMLKLRTNLQYQKRQSFRLASVLVNIVLAKEMGLDPSTLLLLQNGLMDLDTLKKFQSDPQIRSQWKRGVFAVQQEIWQMLKEKDDFRLDQIDSEGFLDLLKDAQINVQKVNQSGISRRLLEDITRESSLVARQFLAGVANFGRSDHLFLKGLIASPFVGRQTAQEAISDHAILVGMNSFYTLRADPEHIEKLAYSESGAPMHYFNVTMNTIVHLLMAGPRRALVYQSIKEGVETNYLPIQSTLLSVAAKPEQFFRGFMHWTTELIKLPRSNVGSYYVKEAIKQVTTAQAGLILALIGRSYVGEMPLGTALNTTLFYWVASMIGFAWPWALVSRGNNMEEARLARESRRHRLAIENLGKALQQKNESEIQKQTAELVEMTSSEAVVKAFGKISPPILQFMETNSMMRLVTRTQIIIAPGYNFKIANALVTNFHQPESTLLLLVAALIGDDWRC